MKRRSILRGIGAVGIAGTAGCLDDLSSELLDDDSQTDDGPTDDGGEPRFDFDDITMPDGVDGTNPYVEHPEIEVWIENIGDDGGETTVTLSVAGTEETEDIMLGEGESTLVAFPVDESVQPGIHEVTVSEDTTSRTLEDELAILPDPDDFSVSGREADGCGLGEFDFTFTFEVTNDGGVTVDNWDQLELDVSFVNEDGAHIETKTISGTPPESNRDAIWDETYDCDFADTLEAAAETVYLEIESVVGIE